MDDEAEGRNPTWSRDELILALDFYMAHRPNFPGKESDEISELSSDISSVGKLLGLSGSDKFRNPNGVYMKLMNFRRFDPDYTAEGKVGLERGGKGDEEVWNEFAGDPDRLSHTDNIIRQRLQNVDAQEQFAEEEPEIAEAPEGKIVTRLHRRRERSRKLVDAKKKAFKKANGRIFCEACGFDYERVYGARGKDFIECRHTKPVHTLDEGEKTALSDLVLLCANCHRMVHAKSQWLNLQELKLIIPKVIQDRMPDL